MADPGKAEPEVILVADDIPANVELLLDQLNSLGYETITAVDGPSAVAAAFEHQPDLCILDVSMPAGDLGGLRSLPEDQARSAHFSNSSDLRDRTQRHK